MTLKARSAVLVVPLALVVNVAHAQTISIQKTALAPSNFRIVD